MTTATRSLLDNLRTRGVRLWLDGDNLVVNASRGALTDHELTELKARKPDLVAALTCEDCGPTHPGPYACGDFAFILGEWYLTAAGSRRRAIHCMRCCWRWAGVRKEA